MGEFDLIRKFFLRPPQPQAGVMLAGGDDCALLAPASGMQLAVSSDMLVEGRHFLSTVDPRALGHKALAVNLSDLAACGAQPMAFTLALALPRVDEAWIAELAGGLLGLADQHACHLVGGDTTAGPLTLCITVFGQVPAGTALLRSGAKPGDDLYVSGTLGDARLALEAFRGRVQLPAAAFAHARERMERPCPRVALGVALRGIASSAIDISDGLAGDLGHILQASRVGAVIDAEVASTLIANKEDWTLATAPFDSQSSPKEVLDLVLAGGDDYELAFTAPPGRRDAVAAAAARASTAVTRVGCIDDGPGLRLRDAAGQLLPSRWGGFDHFAA